MDHMRISGTEPSSVILSQTKFQKLKSDVPKVPNQAKVKRECVINPNILTDKRKDTQYMCQIIQ